MSCLRCKHGQIEKSLGSVSERDPACLLQGWTRSGSWRSYCAVGRSSQTFGSLPTCSEWSDLSSLDMHEQRAV